MFIFLRRPTATNISGSEITFNVGNITYGFNATLNSTSSDGTLHQQFSFLGTEPVELGNGTTLYDAFEDLTVYRNATSNETQVQVSLGFRVVDSMSGC